MDRAAMLLIDMTALSLWIRSLKKIVLFLSVCSHPKSLRSRHTGLKKADSGTSRVDTESINRTIFVNPFDECCVQQSKRAMI
ncbi:hypothetical protein BX666DRAFT_1973566 [Dichotomocladium elegans]|nr:hypothetical protein BX666DRAFT_1973566 [Dichotomocladium elegans]